MNIILVGDDGHPVPVTLTEAAEATCSALLEGLSLAGWVTTEAGDKLPASLFRRHVETEPEPHNLEP